MPHSVSGRRIWIGGVWGSLNPGSRKSDTGEYKKGRKKKIKFLARIL